MLALMFLTGGKSLQIYRGSVSRLLGTRRVSIYAAVTAAVPCCIGPSEVDGHLVYMKRQDHGHDGREVAAQLPEPHASCSEKMHWEFTRVLPKFQAGYLIFLMTANGGVAHWAG